MDLTRRKKILQSFAEIENEDFIKDWYLYDVNIWPIVKETLYFEGLKNLGKYDLLKILVRNVLFDLKQKKKGTKIEFDEANFLFTGNDATRIIKNDLSHNKYFDPIMDYLENNNQKSLIAEFSTPENTNFYKKNRVVVGSKYLSKSSRNIGVNNLKDLTELESVIESFSKEFNLNRLVIINKIKLKLNITFMWEDFYEKLLKRITPKSVFMLCYYCEPCYGIMLAANRLKIPTVDMQHGGQGDLHFAYTYPKKLADLNLLPSYFWVWDNSSYRHLKDWLKEDRIILGGNPSLSENQENNPVKEFIHPDDILILYTLQTTIKPYVPPFLVDAIKNAPANYKWWFRFHPRMKKEEKDEVYAQMIKENIINKINFKEPNIFSLSEILKVSRVHLSSFSGSLMEAAIFNVPLNFTFSEIGKQSYNELINDGKLKFYPFNNNESLIDLIHNSDLTTDKVTTKDEINFKNVMNNFINNIKG